MLNFLIILITIPSLLADTWDSKPYKREEYVIKLFRRTPIPIWRRTPPSIFPNRDKNTSVEIPIWRRTPQPMDAKTETREEFVTTLYRRTPIPIWRRTPPPIFPSTDKNNSLELPIWRRTPPPIFPNRDINNSGELQRGDKLRNKSLYKIDDVKKLSLKWIVKDIYHLKKNDLARQAEIKNMGRWILRWDLWDKKFKFGKYNRTDYLMYSRWRFLYEPPISNIIDYFKNLLK